MATMTLTGASGKIYSFEIYSLDGELPSEPGCYAVTKTPRRRKNSDRLVYPLVYIGQSEDIEERFESHEKEDCFTEHKATRVGIHRTRTKVAAMRVEDDILDGDYDWPCNKD